MLALLATAALGSQCASMAPTTAQKFTYEDMGTYQKVTSTECSETYILYPRERAKYRSSNVIIRWLIAHVVRSLLRWRDGA